MKNLYRTVCFLTVSVLFNTLMAQSVGFTKYNFPNHKQELSNALSDIKEGDKYYERGPGMFRLAIEQYMKANKFNPNNALLNYKIGRCHLYDNDKSASIKYFLIYSF